MAEEHDTDPGTGTEAGAEAGTGLNTKRPFTRADAVRAGIRPSQLGSRFRRIFRDVFIAEEVLPTRREKVEGALLLHPKGARASHVTAAQLCRVPVPDHSEVHISVARAKDRRFQPGIKCHVSPPGTDFRLQDGIPVSKPQRLFIELASMLTLVDLVVAGDAILRVFHLKAAAFREGLSRSRDYWSPAARAAAAYVRDEVDSPMETRLRMLIVLAGLPEPVVNHKLRNRDGEVLVRFDLAYPAVHQAIEYDGRPHVEVRANWESDIDRRELVQDEEWRIITVTSRGIYVEPGRTIRKIELALRRLGVRIGRLSNEWRIHFPGRQGNAAA
ncbi:hypothetical protein [Nocardioides panaciterrulae]|uniref:DUF559 domain-containing protein n=1 Tax=Nocardioides panaciterrulae TaxID=661492 RepID=A0A7Y9E2T4_9ACTN|nr:hypothetical protein [Nocardioides panaciterrulae]NYD40005.1 hypothetical protein [Nocardioides panaciterrulae]